MRDIQNTPFAKFPQALLQEEPKAPNAEQHTQLSFW